MESKQEEGGSQYEKASKAELLFHDQHVEVDHNGHIFIGRAAMLVGVSIQTIRKYCFTGLLNPERNSAGWRVFTDADILKMRQFHLDNVARCGWTKSQLTENRRG